MEKKLAKIVLAILFVFPFCAQAVTFTSDANIQSGDNYVYGGDIYDTPPNHTTVTMTGGTVGDSMRVHDASILNMSGGNVFGLGALENSTVNISGGSVAGLDLYGNATATISQNAIIYSAAVMESSILNMNGGTVANLGGDENSILNISGGNISDMLGAYGNTIINVYGYDLSMTQSGGTHGVGQITGYWLNDSQFTINLGGTDAYTHINLIPEPTSLLLLGVGAFLLRKSHK